MEPNPHNPEAAAAGPAQRSRAGKGRPRLWAALVLALTLAVLGVAAWLKPDPRGFGTHQQLGAHPCGMLIQTGLPCPTCGMTTAFAHTVRGQWIRAFLAQPTGFVLALATIACAGGAVWVLGKGRYPAFNLLWLTPFRLLLALLVLLLGGWGFKLVYGLATGTLPVGPVRL